MNTELPTTLSDASNLITYYTELPTTLYVASSTSGNHAIMNHTEFSTTPLSSTDPAPVCNEIISEFPNVPVILIMTVPCAIFLAVVIGIAILLLIVTKTKEASREDLNWHTSGICTSPMSSPIGKRESSIRSPSSIRNPSSISKRSSTKRSVSFRLPPADQHKWVPPIESPPPTTTRPAYNPWRHSVAVSSYPQLTDYKRINAHFI